MTLTQRAKLWELMKEAILTGRGRMDSDDPKWVNEDLADFRRDFNKILGEDRESLGGER